MKNKLTVVFILLGLLTACGSADRKKTEARMQRYVVKAEPLHKTLYFTGTIQPLGESSLICPMDAVVETMPFHYGQTVKKGEVIFTLSSHELQKQYNETLTDYLKAKDNYSVAQTKFTGTQELWDAGLLSKNNFLSEKSSLATARVALMQATSKLTEMLEKIDDSAAQNLSKLSITEFDKVRQALTGNHNLIRLKAPRDGILLYPPKTGEDKSGKLTVGTSVKAGQVIALVGDLSGLSVDIEIPEIDIDKMHTGMRAKITGIALGKQILEGEVVAVNAQASTVATAALPSFSAVVEVKTLNESQRPWVKVGMSASIEIDIDEKEQLVVPIAALIQEKGRAVVNIQSKDGAVKRIITTGAAQADKVVVAAGLKAGEVIVYD